MPAMDDRGVNINTVTWGRFLPQLRALGVDVRTTPEGHQYLYRLTAQDNGCYYHLPEKFREEDRVTNWVFDCVVRRLKLDQNRDFRGWYHAL